MVGVHPDDLPAGILLRKVDSDRPEPARPQQSVIDQIDPVGRTDDQNWHLGPETVQLGEQLGHDRVARPAAAVVPAGAPGRDRVELVEDDHGRGVAAGLGEQFTDLAFALPDIHVGDLRPADHQDGGGQAGGHGLGEQRLARPRRAVEDEPAWHQVVAQMLGQVDGTADDGQRPFQLGLDVPIAADRRERHVRHLERTGCAGLEHPQLVAQVGEGGPPGRADRRPVLVVGEPQGVAEPDGVHPGHVLVQVGRVETVEQLGLCAGDQRPADRHPLTGAGRHLPGQDLDRQPHREPVGQHLGDHQGWVGERQQHAGAALVEDVGQLAGLARQRRVSAAGQQIQVRHDDHVTRLGVGDRGLQCGQQFGAAPAAERGRIPQTARHSRRHSRRRPRRQPGRCGPAAEPEHPRRPAGPPGDLVRQVFDQQLLAPDEDGQAAFQVRDSPVDLHIVRDQDGFPLAQRLRMARFRGHARPGHALSGHAGPGVGSGPDPGCWPAALG